MNGVVPGKADPDQAPKSTGADARNNCAPCHVMHGGEGLCWSGHTYGMSAGTVEQQGDQEWLSMEVAEPKYPIVTTLGNNEGLSLPGV